MRLPARAKKPEPGTSPKVVIFRAAPRTSPPATLDRLAKDLAQEWAEDSRTVTH